MYSIVTIPIYSPTNGKGGFPFFHTLSSSYCFIDFLMMVIVTSVKWHLIVVLICISLIISGVEHLFMFLWSISLSSLEKCLFRSSHIFWFGCLFFWYWATWAIRKFWRLIPCCIVCKYFLPFCGLFFLFCLWFPFLCKSFWV